MNKDTFKVKTYYGGLCKILIQENKFHKTKEAKLSKLVFLELDKSNSIFV